MEGNAKTKEKRGIIIIVYIITKQIGNVLNFGCSVTIYPTYKVCLIRSIESYYISRTSVVGKENE